MKQPKDNRPGNPPQETRQRSSAFRSVSPLIRTSRQKTEPYRSPVAKLGKKKVSVGGHFSLTLGTILLIAAIVMVVVGPPLVNLVSGIEQRNKVHAQLVAAQAENQRLREELELWDDPDYVSEQARKRLGYVKPGETRFTVVDPGEDYNNSQQLYETDVPDQPWYLEIAKSAQLAGSADESEAGLSAVQAGKEATASPGATPSSE